LSEIEYIKFSVVHLVRAQRGVFSHTGNSRGNFFHEVYTVCSKGCINRKSEAVVGVSIVDIVIIIFKVFLEQLVYIGVRQVVKEMCLFDNNYVR